MYMVLLLYEIVFQRLGASIYNIHTYTASYFGCELAKKFSKLYNKLLGKAYFIVLLPTGLRTVYDMAKGLWTAAQHTYMWLMNIPFQISLHSLH